MMLEVPTAAQLRQALDEWRSRGEHIALVPTMGNLHEGHLQLVDRARERADRVVVSLFVNPTQFGPGEDLDNYPRTLDDDRAALAARGADLLFVPDEASIYPHGRKACVVSVPGLSDMLCGASRPGHFDGVATVVSKLLNLVAPDVAVFGEKDYQQLMIIRHMVADLFMPMTIEGVPTCRETDGLAMSSRNRYLSKDERRRAPALYQALQRVARALEAGRTDYDTLAGEARKFLSEKGLEPDYVEIRRSENLATPTPSDRALVVLAAARLGKARLIDNLRVSLETA